VRIYRTAASRRVLQEIYGLSPDVAAFAEKKIIELGKRDSKKLMRWISQRKKDGTSSGVTVADIDAFSIEKAWSEEGMAWARSLTGINSYAKWLAAAYDAGNVSAWHDDNWDDVRIRDVILRLASRSDMPEFPS